MVPKSGGGAAAAASITRTLGVIYGLPQSPQGGGYNAGAPLRWVASVAMRARFERRATASAGGELRRGAERGERLRLGVPEP